MSSGRIFNASTVFFDLTKYLILAVVVVSIFLVLVGVPLLIQGESMEPNFQSGELVIVERLSYFGAKPIKRGDVVAATFPGDPKKTRLIKRVVGLPGETIGTAEGKISVNGIELAEPYRPKYGVIPYQEMSDLTLKYDEYYLAGDNRPGSSDSRLWGAVAKGDIQGRASFIIYPFRSLRYIDRIQ